MGELEPGWSRRHKRRGRRVGYDLRLAAPLLAIALCLASSATAILAVEQVVPAVPPAPEFAVLSPMAGVDCRPRE